MARIFRTTSSGHLAMRTGGEGPTHDPYSFTEWECERQGHTLVLHLGLGAWLKLDGKTYLPEAKTDADMVAAFEEFTDLTIQQVDKALHRRPRMSAKERRMMDEIEAADAALLRYAM